MKEQEFYEMLGAVLRQERKKRGLSLVDVAKRLNISKSSLAYYETGERAISALMLKRYCDLLGYSLDEIFAKVMA